MRKWLILPLLLLMLACNFPGFPGSETIIVTPTVATATTDEEATAPGDSSEDEDDRPQPTVTQTKPPSTPTKTVTPTATSTPGPTPEPTQVEPGPPLNFADPAWELVTWSQIPDTIDWTGTIRIHVNGGTPPYRSQLENQEIVEGLEVEARWRLCKAMPATIRVWSADDQHVETAIWVWELGCDEDE